MSGSIEERNVKAATQALALLHAQADGVRAELEQLRETLAQLRSNAAASRAEELLKANEQLVLAAAHAETIAETAVRNLDALTHSSQRDGLTDTPGQTPMLERETRLQSLREANEQLLIAALSAQEHEADAKDAHGRQLKFMAMVAHELRNPLTPIRIAAGMLDRARSDMPQFVRLQEIIEGQVTHIARLVDDLLDGSRISMGKLRLERSRVDMSRVLDVALETCRPGMEARLQQLTVQLRLGALSVHGDPVRLVQVFSNLLDNASKYTPDGGRIDLAADVSGEAMVVTVSDNGIGISAEALPHIFDLFVQDTHAMALRKGGLGIGLAVVRELVEAHGGSVVGSSAGKDCGSKFVVTLPVTGPAPAARAGEGSASR